MKDEREELRSTLVELVKMLGIAFVVFAAIALGLGILFSIGKYVYGFWS